MNPLLKSRLNLKPLLLLFLAPLAGLAAEPARVVWEAPTARTDGTVLPASELESFRLCVADSPDGGCLHSRILEGTLTQVPIQQLELEYGTWYLTLYAIDTAGRESGPSEVAELFLVAPPNPPARLGAN